MTEKLADQDHADPSAPTALMVEPAFVLLFSIHLKDAFKGFGSSPRASLPGTTAPSWAQYSPGPSA